MWVVGFIFGISFIDFCFVVFRLGGKRLVIFEIIGVVVLEEEFLDRIGEVGRGRLERRGVLGELGDGSWGSEEFRLGVLVIFRYLLCRVLVGGFGVRVRVRFLEKVREL